MKKNSRSFKSVVEKDSEIREHEKILEEMANEKDSEKRRFGEIVLKYVCFAALMVVAFAIGGKANIELPEKKDIPEKLDKPEDNTP